MGNLSMWISTVSYCLLCWTGKSPFLHATTSGNLNTFECLLEKGVDPESSTSRGYSPLHCAAEKGVHIYQQLVVGSQDLCIICIFFPCVTLFLKINAEVFFTTIKEYSNVLQDRSCFSTLHHCSILTYHWRYLFFWIIG